jgi:predicted ribosome quality control (RQC) complex YloA/Tae2 family protein
VKQGMTNVDVAALAAELAPLVVGGRLDRAYQPGKETILLRLRRKGTGRVDLLFELGKFLTATARPPENPDKPSMVAQILRSNLENARVTAFRQVGFDRLLRMDLERGDGVRSLVFELFGDGNLVLLDGDGTILLPMRAGEFSARRVKKGEVYAVPPGSAHPFALDGSGLRKAAEEGRSRDLVRFLALDLGFGPLWAEELCLRANVEKSTRLEAMGDPEWGAVHAAVQALGRDIARNDLEPSLVHQAGSEAPVDAVPFAMRRYPEPKFSHEQAPSFREALDAFFVGVADGDEEPDDPRRAQYDEARGRIERQFEEVRGAIVGCDERGARARPDAEALYASFNEASGILDALNKARRERSWADVEATLAAGRAEGNPFAQQVEALRPHDGTAVLRLKDIAGQERSVQVDLRLSVQENAEALYEEAKKAKQRREGALVALEDARKKLRELEAKGLDAFGAAPQRAVRLQRHFWFESYRWTVTPRGLLAVGGRSAAQNDAVVKKYLREGDRYAHAEIHGAPSVVVRPPEGASIDVPPEDLRVACHFAAVSSRAWRQGGDATAYWVTPEQVSKTPRSGEYVPKGAWIIHGKRNVENGLPMTWWVGLMRFTTQGIPVPRKEWDAGGRTIEKLVGASLETLQTYAAGCLRLVPGRMDVADAAQTLAARFGVPIEDAQAVLPPGPVEILEEPAHPLEAQP